MGNRTGAIIILSKFTDLERNVYFFMFNKYSELTNLGEDYTGNKVEEHDSVIENLASEKYGLSVEEVGAIYNNVETLLGNI